MGQLTNPRGDVIVTTDRDGKSTHDCRQGCRLHSPCCPEYARTGWEHTGDCYQTQGEAP